VRRAALLCFLCVHVPACVPDDPPKDKRLPTPPRPNVEVPQHLPPFTGNRGLVRPPGLPSVAPPAPSASAAATTPEHDPLLTSQFTDGFDRAVIGADWSSTGAAWRIEGGRLCVERARNHGIWLRRRLPTNARIEFDAMSTSPEGDLKAELWGDGHSAADSISYNDATSYLTIFGGWKNSFHVLARIDEHAPDRPQVPLDDGSDDLRAKKVVPGRSYHFKVVRDDGRTVRWLVDDLEILTYPDPKPLTGQGHDHFGFNDWDVHVCFDNLVITPLLPPGAGGK
jgi:hypothetical protein